MSSQPKEVVHVETAPLPLAEQQQQQPAQLGADITESEGTVMDGTPTPKRPRVEDADGTERVSARRSESVTVQEAAPQPTDVEVLGISESTAAGAADITTVSENTPTEAEITAAMPAPVSPQSCHDTAAFTDIEEEDHGTARNDAVRRATPPTPEHHAETQSADPATALSKTPGGTPLGAPADAVSTEACTTVAAVATAANITASTAPHSCTPPKRSEVRAERSPHRPSGAATPPPQVSACDIAADDAGGEVSGATGKHICFVESAEVVTSSAWGTPEVRHLPVSPSSPA